MGLSAFFPTGRLKKDAEFHNLRAAGAFLVSAKLESGKVTGVEILSEAGTRLKIVLPWQDGGTIISQNGKSSVSESIMKQVQKREKRFILNLFKLYITVLIKLQSAFIFIK